MRVRAGLPRGVSALLFDDARARRRLEARIGQELERRGLAEVILPILDYFTPYESLLDEQQKDGLYRFVDRDGQLLALRGDFTPLLARLLAPRLSAEELPLQLFYRGDVIRHQEEGPSRLRETSQLGAEWISAPGSVSGAQLLRSVLETLLAVLLPELPESGAQRRIEVVLGIAGALDPLIERCGEAGSDLTAALARRDREAVRQVADPTIASTLLEVVEDGAPADAALLGDALGADLAALRRVRDEFVTNYSDDGVAFSIDLAEFLPSSGSGSGLHHDYYEGPVLRVFLPGAPEPIANGGRYDALFRTLGADVMAGGFSLGLDQLLEVSVNGFERRAAETAVGGGS